MGLNRRGLHDRSRPRCVRSRRNGRAGRRVLAVSGAGVIVSTDNLRAIADDMDEAGVSLDGFVLIAVQAEDGGRVRIIGSLEDREANATVLRLAIKMLRGGVLQ